MSNKMRVIFMGTPDFAVPALQAIIDAGHDVIGVYSQPPRPAGRGHKLKPSPVHKLAEDNDIEVYTPLNFKDDADVQIFKELNADIAVVAAYGLILPESILSATKHGCINIHASLLPKWRGAAPIHRSILAGDDQSGVCIMEMEKGLDTGGVLLEQSTPIDEDTTSASLHDNLAQIGATMINEALSLINGGDYTFAPQNHDQATYAHKLKKEEGLIDWTQDAAQIDRQIRAFTPWPGTWTDLPFDHGRLKIIDADYISEAKGTPGELLDKTGLIACGTGGIRLKTVQPQSRGKMSMEAFLNGSDLTIGMTFNTEKNN